MTFCQGLGLFGQLRYERTFVLYLGRNGTTSPSCLTSNIPAFWFKYVSPTKYLLAQRVLGLIAMLSCGGNTNLGFCDYPRERLQLQGPFPGYFASFR